MLKFIDQPYMMEKNLFIVFIFYIMTQMEKKKKTIQNLKDARIVQNTCVGHINSTIQNFDI